MLDGQGARWRAEKQAGYKNVYGRWKRSAESLLICPGFGALCLHSSCAQLFNNFGNLVTAVPYLG